MHDFDVALIGIGPISKRLLEVFINRGQRVAIISRQAQPKYISENCFWFTWSEVIQLRVFCKTAFLNWRLLPHGDLAGQKLINWISSDDFQTRKLLHLSSGSVYSNGDTPYLESDFESKSDKSKGNSKQTLEFFVEELGNVKRLRFVNLRLSNVYGHPLEKGFIGEAISHLSDGKPMRVFSDVDITRDYVHVDDVISALVLLSQKELHWKAINISTSRGMKISQLLELFERLCGETVSVFSVVAPKGIAHSNVLNCDLLKSVIDWEPKTIEELLLGEYSKALLRNRV